MRCPMAPGPHPRAGRTESPRMARTLLFLIRLRHLRPKEGTHERQRLASSYSWYRFPGLSHLSRLEARGWLLKDNCAPCDSGSARVNPSLRAPELGPHLPHIPDHGSSGRSGALRSLPGRGAAIGPQLTYCTGGRAIVMHEMTSTRVKVSDTNLTLVD